ncbi:MAG: class I SAM-dependent methyltransferase [Gammaproteobacteria bacterium]|nr:class I SAM-dependent methyltransferase [Gammaproteobacteria bacterium]
MNASGREPRGYQNAFSDLVPGVFDRASRERKAVTALRVLEDRLGPRLADCRVVDVGASSGIIDARLAPHVREVVGIDIDEKALRFARERAPGDRLRFACGDAMSLPLADASVDVVFCAHVYEHVPDAERMMAEIHRVLRPGGYCYFAAGNRFQLVEPHYRIPLLSAMPRWLAHRVIRRLGVADHYHELHLSLFGLKRLTRRFRRHDYTLRLIRDHRAYATTYLLPGARWKRALIRRFAGLLYPLIPTYIWLLEKEGPSP